MAKEVEVSSFFNALHNESKNIDGVAHNDDDRDTNSHSASESHLDAHHGGGDHTPAKASSESMDFEAVESIMWRKVSQRIIRKTTDSAVP